MDPPADLDDACKSLVASWRAASSDLEALNGEIRELHEKLRERTARQRALAAREVALKQQLMSQCTEESLVRYLEKSCAEEKRREQDRSHADKRPGQRQPTVFEISAPLAAEEADVDAEECPTMPDGELQQAEEASTRSLSEDIWEDSLDVVGVVKCGLCGLRFPLSDNGGMEAHYAECEASFAQDTSSWKSGGRFTGAASSPQAGRAKPQGGSASDSFGPALY
mmetsp:Transcript_58388/g.173772  ORF Transcript_58388/g.173772 Transcript_58388/m.173772 type:complete len:224 (+) Transcript_58388:90-761(+)